MQNDPVLAKAFGQILRARREKSGLTQAVLAERIQSSPSYIQYLEYGQNQPSLTTLVRLAEALAAEPGEFLQDAVRLYRVLQSRAITNFLPK